MGNEHQIDTRSEPMNTYVYCYNSKGTSQVNFAYVDGVNAREARKKATKKYPNTKGEVYKVSNKYIPS